MTQRKHEPGPPMDLANMRRQGRLSADLFEVPAPPKP